MKTLITIIIFSWSTLAIALPKPTDVTKSKSAICFFKSADIGSIKFQGVNRDQAVEKTAKACLRARVALYKSSRGKRPSVERRILFAENCVNNTHCKR